MKPFLALVSPALLLLSAATCAFGSSVLTHEALVDAMWDKELQPILQAKYRNLTPESLKNAHAYAYGGAILQDLGYYPHGSAHFSDLTHYVRTGDFVLSLLANAKDPNEFAFALGALSHYTSDIDVHRFATNRAEAMLYPKLARKFGPVVTYEQDPAAHLKTEFGFDVLEVARGNFSPQAYHDFIGFNVAAPLIGRAFLATYGFDLKSMFPDFERAVGSYRRTVSRTIPMATRTAWAQKSHEIQGAQPGMTQRKFIYLMSRSSYEQEWGKQYDLPTTSDRALALALKLLPPIGPLRALRFKMPTPAAEKLFMQSFSRAAAQYRTQLDALSQGSLRLPNLNYDLGQLAPPATYALEDKAYAYWLEQLAIAHYEQVTPPIRADILNYYCNLDAPFKTKKHERDWTALLGRLQQLKTQTVADR